MINEDERRTVFTLVFNMSNSQLHRLLEHVQNEIRLSENAIEEGLEVME